MEHEVDAVDVFDWNHLVEIGVNLDLAQVRNLADAVRLFAYAFTSVSKIEDQNRMLAEWLGRATYKQSAETAEAILASLAAYTRANLELLRTFARQNGVRLRRG